MKINSMTLAGNIGRDAEVRYTPSGKAVADISIALDQGYGDKKSVVWTKLTVWEKTAEYLSDAKTGDNIIASNVEYRTEDYENKDGVKVTKHYFLAGKFSRVGIIQKPIARVDTSPEYNQDNGQADAVDESCPF